MHMKFLVALLTMTAFFSLNANADVRILDRGEGKSILIDGVITASDYQSFIDKAAIVQKQDPIGVAVKLNSQGGNLETAMKIGRFIRNTKWYVQIFLNQDAICASSCVFILAGAERRNVQGKVVIHRPYLDNDNATTAAKQKVNYKKIEKMVKAYFEEMNVPLSLYDEMLAISTDTGRVLTDSELSKFNLTGLDLYEEEATKASETKELGITKTELNKRYNRLNWLCAQEYEEFKNATDEASPAVKNYEDCRNDVMKGIKK